MSLCKIKRKKIEPCHDIKQEIGKHLFRSEKEMVKAMKTFCRGDLYIIGRMWIESMKHVLLGTKFTLFPVVEAAAPNDKEPQKPPKTKYKDLPIYTSPHFDYKDNQAKKEKCADADVKLAQKAILPAVSDFRSTSEETIKSLAEEIKCTYKEVSADIKSAVDVFKKYVRDPSNPIVKNGVVLLGTLAGAGLSRNKPLYKRFLYITAGTLAGGFLSYPAETDQVVRTAFYHFGKAIICGYNILNEKNLTIREPYPCDAKKQSHVPPPPPPSNKMCEEKPVPSK